MRTCYYELLGVERDAEKSEIKKAYMKLALKWHPDKNNDNVEEATKKFTEILAAYEVLSDPNERTWYDNHRESILRGDDGGSSNSDFLPNLMPFFSSSAYKGFGNDDKGFYSIYREVFDSITVYESKYRETQDFEDPPTFGNANSNYETIKKFYTFWGDFSSQMSFGWCEKYNLAEAPNRQVRRLMEKDNQKSREIGKKEFNETVRKLVEFVKKRDKRLEVELAKKQEEAKKKAEENKKKIAEQKKERQKKVNDYQAPEWAQIDEKQLNNLIKEHVGDYDEEDDEYYCVACKKRFRSEKQWENHERSKKHNENIALLKLEMEEEDQFEGISSDQEMVIEDDEDGDGDVNIESNEESIENNEDNEDGNEENEENEKSEQEENDEENEEYLASIAAEMSLNKDKDEEEESESDDEDQKKSTKKDEKKVKKPRRRKKEKGQPSQPLQSQTQPQTQAFEDEEWKCNTCREHFPSRNKLFTHLKKTGHQSIIPSETTSKSKSRKR